MKPIRTFSPLFLHQNSPPTSAIAATLYFAADESFQTVPDLIRATYRLLSMPSRSSSTFPSQLWPPLGRSRAPTANHGPGTRLL